MTMVADVTLFPWENVDMAVREQAEQEIWSDAEYQQWLDALLTVPVEEMTELEFLAHAADQAEAQNVEKTLMFVDVMLRAPRTGGWDLLPEWQRDGYVGM